MAWATNLALPVEAGERERWEWVHANPFRAHVRGLLCETGLPWRALAEYAGVPDRMVERLMQGRGGRSLRRLPRPHAVALLLVDADQLLRAMRRPVPVRATERHCRLLQDAGFDAATIATMVDLRVIEVECLLAGAVGSVPYAAQLRAAAACRAHRLVDAAAADPSSFDEFSPWADAFDGPPTDPAPRGAAAARPRTSPQAGWSPPDRGLGSDPVAA